MPPIALLWLNSQLRNEYDLSSLRVLQVGGAKLSEQVARRIQPELGCTLQQVFGMAEGLVNYTRLGDDTETICTSQGLRISPSDEVLVLDDAGKPVTPGTPGNLLTRGPYTIRGYYHAPEHNAKSFTADGFYCTGDIVVEDNRGYLRVVGRAKDQINRGGEKIAPEEVENALLAHPAIHDASVVGMPDEILGERTKAYIIFKSGATTPSAFALKKFVRQCGLAEYKVPDEFEFVERFPETFVGKVSKNAQRATES